MFYEGQKIGPYKLVKKIAKGGFGEVWLAEKRSEFVTKKVAVKLPLDDQVDFEEIRHEATLWEKASGHPNVLPIIDADVYDGQAAIVSEFADGGSLADRLKKEGKFPVRQAVETIIGILNGLEYLHSKNIIHRDVKPANILLQGGTPRLADFGISRALHSNTVSSAIVGTQAYMAPEAFEGQRSVQTDLWSVGVILYQFLTGKLPFPQKNAMEVMYAVLQKEPEPLPEEIPGRLREIVLKALEKDFPPEEANRPRRYQTAAEMREDLKDFLETISRRPVLATMETTKIVSSPAAPAPAPAAATTIPQTELPEIQTKIRKPISGELNTARDTARDLVYGRFSPQMVFLFILGVAAVLGVTIFMFVSKPDTVSLDSNTSLANLPVSSNSDSNVGPGSNSSAVSQTVLDYFQEGNKYYGEKKFDRAIKAYTKAIELNPRDFTFYNNRGLAFYNKRSFDEAIADFNKAIEISPTATNYNNRGVAYEDKGDIEQAINDYRKALEIDPSYQTANDNLNKILR